MKNKILDDKAQKIFYFLSLYINIHNNYISQTNSFFSIFKKIDFRQYSNILTPILVSLDEELISLANMDKKKLDSQELKFATKLEEYGESLLKAMQAFDTILLALEKKANGEKLDWAEHKQNYKIYEEKQQEYVIVGRQLNQFYQQLK